MKQPPDHNQQEYSLPTGTETSSQLNLYPVLKFISTSSYSFPSNHSEPTSHTASQSPDHIQPFTITSQTNPQSEPLPIHPFNHTTTHPRTNHETNPLPFRPQHRHRHRPPPPNNPPPRPPQLPHPLHAPHSPRPRTTRLSHAVRPSFSPSLILPNANS